MEHHYNPEGTSTPTRDYSSGTCYTIPNDIANFNNTPSQKHEVTTLELVAFSKPPTIDFGLVTMGVASKRFLKIENPYDHPVEVAVEKVPQKKNFTVDPSFILLEGEKSGMLEVKWEPNFEGGVRELVILKVNNSFRLQFVVLGESIGSAVNARKSRHPSRKRQVDKGLCYESKSSHQFRENMAFIAKNKALKEDNLIVNDENASDSFSRPRTKLEYKSTGTAEEDRSPIRNKIDRLKLSSSSLNSFDDDKLRKSPLKLISNREDFIQAKSFVRHESYTTETYSKDGELVKMSSSLAFTSYSTATATRTNEINYNDASNWTRPSHNNYSERENSAERNLPRCSTEDESIKKEKSKNCQKRKSAKRRSYSESKAAQVGDPPLDQQPTYYPALATPRRESKQTPVKFSSQVKDPWSSSLRQSIYCSPSRSLKKTYVKKPQDPPVKRDRTGKVQKQLFSQELSKTHVQSKAVQLSKPSASANLSRYGTYTKLNEEGIKLVEDKENTDMSEDSIEQVTLKSLASSPVRRASPCKSPVRNSADKCQSNKSTTVQKYSAKKFFTQPYECNRVKDDYGVSECFTEDSSKDLIRPGPDAVTSPEITRNYKYLNEKTNKDLNLDYSLVSLENLKQSMNHNVFRAHQLVSETPPAQSHLSRPSESTDQKKSLDFCSELTKAEQRKKQSPARTRMNQHLLESPKLNSFLTPKIKQEPIKEEEFGRTWQKKKPAESADINEFFIWINPNGTVSTSTPGILHASRSKDEGKTPSTRFQMSSLSPIKKCRIDSTPSKQFSREKSKASEDTPAEKKKAFETFVLFDKKPVQQHSSPLRRSANQRTSSQGANLSHKSVTVRSDKTVGKPRKRSHEEKSHTESTPTKKTPEKDAINRTYKKGQNSLKGSKKTVTKTKLTLIGKNKANAAAPKHLMPYAARNIFYDERWMEKQERGFIKWMNFVLAPPELTFEVQDHGALSLDCDKHLYPATPGAGETKESLSVKAYAGNWKFRQLRKAACKLYRSSEVAKVIVKVEKEIELGRLAVRTDRPIHADFGLKKEVTKMIMSYNLLWLRIALETIYGEILPLSSDLNISCFLKFLNTRLFACPEIAALYAHPTVVNLYREGFQGAVSKFILKKFLMLVYFLDVAKSRKLICYDPCLFSKDASYKSSRDILLAFSRECLRGEGDITKHLNLLGYEVVCIQTPLDEFDYTVLNLSQDLRDGLRLARLVEILTGSWTLNKELLTPAISRTQKIHNVEAVLSELILRGVSLDLDQQGEITSRDIVDGHREKTLRLLWSIILSCQVQLILNEEALRNEVDCILKELPGTLKDRFISAEIDDIHDHSGHERDLFTTDLYKDDPLLSLLLKWCRIICIIYGFNVENFTVSFSDGRALCYLVHHYHPHLLPLSSIRTCTTLTYLNHSGSNEEDKNFQVENDSKKYKKLLQNEKENFKLLQEKVCQMGGVPLMIHPSDMSNTLPDEKLTITYVSFVCARLLEMRCEIRAARKIQKFWRFYHRKVLQLHSVPSNVTEKDVSRAETISASSKFISPGDVFIDGAGDDDDLVGADDDPGNVELHSTASFYTCAASRVSSCESVKTKSGSDVEQRNFMYAPPASRNAAALLASRSAAASPDNRRAANRSAAASPASRSAAASPASRSLAALSSRKPQVSANNDDTKTVKLIDIWQTDSGKSEDKESSCETKVNIEDIVFDGERLEVKSPTLGESLNQKSPSKCNSVDIQEDNQSLDTFWNKRCPSKYDLEVISVSTISSVVKEDLIMPLTSEVMMMTGEDLVKREVALSSSNTSTTPKVQILDCQTEVDSSAYGDEIVEDYIKEALIQSIALDYNEEVEENLGTKLVDHTKVIYHTPKKCLTPQPHKKHHSRDIFQLRQSHSSNQLEKSLKDSSIEDYVKVFIPPSRIEIQLEDNVHSSVKRVFRCSPPKRVTKNFKSNSQLMKEKQNPGDDKIVDLVAVLNFNTSTLHEEGNDFAIEKTGNQDSSYKNTEFTGDDESSFKSDDMLVADITGCKFASNANFYERLIEEPTSGSNQHLYDVNHLSRDFCEVVTERNIFDKEENCDDSRRCITELVGQAAARDDININQIIDLNRKTSETVLVNDAPQCRDMREDFEYNDESNPSEFKNNLKEMRMGWRKDSGTEISRDSIDGSILSVGSILCDQPTCNNQAVISSENLFAGLRLNDRTETGSLAESETGAGFDLLCKDDHSNKNASSTVSAVSRNISNSNITCVTTETSFECVPFSLYSNAIENESNGNFTEDKSHDAELVSVVAQFVAGTEAISGCGDSSSSFGLADEILKAVCKPCQSFSVVDSSKNKAERRKYFSELRKKHGQVDRTHLIQSMQSLWRKYLLKKDFQNKTSDNLRYIMAEKKFLKNSSVSDVSLRNRYLIFSAEENAAITRRFVLMIHSRKDLVHTKKFSLGSIQVNLPSSLSVLKLWNVVRHDLQNVRAFVKHFTNYKCQHHADSSSHRYISSEVSMRYVPKEVVKVQSLVRRFLARQAYLKKRKCIITLQLFCKRFLARKQYQKQLQSIIHIQTLSRCYVEQKKFKHFIESVVVVQSASRCFLVRRQKEKMIQSATKIQSLFRAYQQRKRYLILKISTDKIQKWWRYMVLKSIQTSSAIKIQSIWRGYKMKCCYKDTIHKIVTVQAVCKGHICKERYQSDREKLIGIQTLSRAYMEKRRYEKKLECTVKLQSYFRGMVARREFLEKKKRIVIIQSLVRRRLCMKEYKKNREKIILIGSLIRSRLARNKYLAVKSSLCAFQRQARLVLARRDQEKKVVLIQSCIRGYLSRQKYKKYLEDVKKCQAAAKRWLVRRRYLKCLENVRKVQCFIRMSIQRKHYLAIKQNLISIQTISRSYVATNKYKSTLKSIIKIQSAVRCFICRRRYQKNVSRLLKVQAFFRGHLTRKRFVERKQSIISIQSIARGFLARRQAELKMINIVKIQSLWRGYYLRKKVEEQVNNGQMVSSLRKIQLEQLFSSIKSGGRSGVEKSWMRCIRKDVERWRAAVVLQMVFRRFLLKKRIEKRKQLKVCSRVTRMIAAVRIQTCFKLYSSRKFEIKRRNSAAIKIQSIWKGYMVRKNHPEIKIKAVRTKLKEATRNATENNTLFSRTLSGLDRLLKYKQLSSIIEALMHLDVATRLSSKCCDRIAEANAVAIILQLIKSCNRSVPHMEIIKYSVSILINLSKYDKTVGQLFATAEGLVELLAELLQNFRENKEIFTSCCLLLSILAVDDKRREEILSKHKAIEKIKAIHVIIDRKYTYERKQNRLKQVGLGLNRQVYGSVTDLALSHHSHASVFSPVWAMKRNARHTLGDSVQAIQYLMKTLNIT